MASTRYRSEVRPLVKRLKQLPISTSSAKANTIATKIAPLITSEATFQELTIDPFLLPADSWNISNSPVSRALGALKDVQELLSVEDPGRSALRDPVQRCLDRIWFPLVAWIEFFLPCSGYVEVRSEAYEHVEAVLYLLLELVRQKNTFSHLLSQAPQLYGRILWLWLHVPEYLPGDADQQLRCHVVWNSILVGAVTKTIARNSSGYGVESNDSEDRYASSQAIAGVHHTPRKIYRLAIRSARQIVDNVNDHGMAYSSEAFGLMERHLALVNDLVVHVLRMDNHARDVVADLVHLARSLEARASSLKAAGRACSVLCEIWMSASSNRPLVWALRDGIFPVLINVSRKLSHDAGWRYLMGGYLCKVAARTAHAPVLRAYMAHKGRASLRTAGCLAEEALGALDSLIATRMAWYKALFAHASYLSHRDARFLMLLANDLVFKVDVKEVLSKVTRMRHTQPSGTKRDVFEVAADFSDMPLESPEVKYVDEDSAFEQREDEPTIIITATLCPLPERSKTPARIIAWSCTLEDLEHYAEERERRRTVSHKTAMNLE
ncbi:hypothetical protein EV121DRAFT_213246 [Schizophyllum commune]